MDCATSNVRGLAMTGYKTGYKTVTNIKKPSNHEAFVAHFLFSS